MSSSKKYLIFGTICLAISASFIGYGFGSIFEEIVYHLGSEEVGAFMKENYPMQFYLFGGGILIGILGVGSLIAGVVVFLLNRKKTDDHTLLGYKILS